MLQYTGEISAIARFARATDFDALAIFTITNLKSAKAVAIQNLLDGRHEEPVFEYNTELLARIDPAEIAELGEYILDHLTIAGTTTAPLDEWARDLFRGRFTTAQDLAKVARCILTGDNETAGRLVLQIYGVPDDFAIRAAALREQAIQSGEPTRDHPGDTRIFTAPEIVKVFQGVIEVYDFPGWSSQVSSTVSAIDVWDMSNCLFVPTARKISSDTLVKRVAHEVESHILGSANVRALLGRLLGPGHPLTPLIPWLAKSYTEEVYEGVAKLRDVATEAALTGGSGASEQPIPWYTLGIERALRGHHTFSETAFWFYDLFRGLGQDNKKAATNAWGKTYRLYRGMTRPHAREYVFTKDYGYLAGFFRLQRLADQDPQFYNLALSFNTLSFDELTALRHAHQAIQAHASGREAELCLSGNATWAATTLLHPRFPYLGLATTGHVPV